MKSSFKKSFDVGIHAYISLFCPLVWMEPANGIVILEHALRPCEVSDVLEEGNKTSV